MSSPDQDESQFRHYAAAMAKTLDKMHPAAIALAWDNGIPVVVPTNRRPRAGRFTIVTKD